MDKRLKCTPIESKKEIGAELFKFRKSKFKTYFVLSTNCVLLADSVIGQAGTDILGIRGFIAPGTYQTYLDQEYEKPHSMVVAKNIYYRKEKWLFVNCSG